MKRDLYALHDYDKEKQKHGAFMVSQDQAAKMNADHYGIFWTVNEFKGARSGVNLVKLQSWFVESDSLPKPEQLKLIKKGLIPSLVIESKKSYHVYFDILECDGSVESYKDMLKHRLVPYYSGDRGACDVARILRAPNYYHCKSAVELFPVKQVFNSTRAYTQKEMESFYPLCVPKKQAESYKPSKNSLEGDGDVFSKIYGLNQAEAISRLNGHPDVFNEVITFHQLPNGKLEMYSNKKQGKLECWIDAAGKIGSRNGAGPTIWNWLYYYHQDHKYVYKIIRHHFPELFTEEQK